MHSIANIWMWLGFFAFVIIMLIVDLLVIGGGRSHKVSNREALAWSLVWFCLALLFNGGIWWYLHHTVGSAIAEQKSLEFFTGYLIEKALSVDNIFVFLMIFSFFAVPPNLQRRVLIYGVIGAIVLRMLMILLGAVLVSEFQWIFYVFGAFLLATGCKMLLVSDKETDLSDNPLLKWLNKHLRITSDFHQEKFFVRQNKLLYITPLFLVLIFVEISDLIFAVDSIPAIFAITSDPFIVFTSNIFAILGLRALYFLLADMAERFHYLKYGLAIILIFIGIKMMIMQFYHIHIGIALGIVGAILAISVLLSFYFPKKQIG